MQDQIEQLKVELKLLIQTRRELAIAIVLFIAVFLVGYFLAYPQYDQISLNQIKVDEAKEQLTTLEERKNNWALAMRSSDYQAYAPLVNEVLPSKKPVVESLYAFNQLQTSHPVNITKFEFAPGELATSGAAVNPTGTNTTATPSRSRATARKTVDNYLLLNLSAVGQFNEMLKFLADMQQMVPIGNIYTLKLNKGVTGSSAAKVEYLSYYYDQNVNAATTTEVPTVSNADRTVLEGVKTYAKLLSAGVSQSNVTGGGKLNVFEAIQESPLPAVPSMDPAALDAAEQTGSLPEVTFP